MNSVVMGEASLEIPERLPFPSVLPGVYKLWQRFQLSEENKLRCTALLDKKGCVVKYGQKSMSLTKPFGFFIVPGLPFELGASSEMSLYDTKQFDDRPLFLAHNTVGKQV
jgi:hypothetical protein